MEFKIEYALDSIMRIVRGTLAEIKSDNERKGFIFAIERFLDEMRGRERIAYPGEEKALEEAQGVFLEKLSIRTKAVDHLEEKDFMVGRRSIFRSSVPLKASKLSRMDSAIELVWRNSMQIKKLDPRARVSLDSLGRVSISDGDLFLSTEENLIVSMEMFVALLESRSISEYTLNIDSYHPCAYNNPK